MKSVNIILYILCCIILFCIYEEVNMRNNKSTVIVCDKRYLPPRIDRYYNTQRYLIYIKRINGSDFMFWSDTRILDVDKSSYFYLNIGDTLKNKY